MKQNDSRFPEQKQSEKLHGDKKSDQDPKDEGRVKEWQDRARVVLDAKEAVKEPAQPNQSPTENKRGEEGVEEKSNKLRKEDRSGSAY